VAANAADGRGLGRTSPVPTDDLHPGLVFPGVGRPHRALATAIAEAAPTRFKPVGTSSLVFQMRLAGDVDAAFRPRTRTHPRGHLAEVAAYRLARALGMEQVPPAVLRRVPRDVLRRRLHPDYRDAWPDIAAEIDWAADGTAPGAAIFWIPDMRHLGVDEDPGLAAWTASLRQAGDAIPAGDVPAHRDLARMVAFDYLIANPDRFSGSNAQGIPGPPRRVFARDHNIAFIHPLRVRLHERIRGHLERTERIPRGFVEGLLELDAPRLAALMETGGARSGDDGGDPGELLLDPPRMAGVLDRREALVSYFAALVDRYGEDAVFGLGGAVAAGEGIPPTPGSAAGQVAVGKSGWETSPSPAPTTSPP